MKTFKQFLEEDREIYAKKIQGAPDWEPSLAEKEYRVGEVVFSAEHGFGSVPFNQSVYYHGFVVMMKPSVFRDIALPEDHQAETAKQLAKFILQGYALGPPFLDMDIAPIENKTGYARIVGHEGRGRMRAIEMANGDKPVPVHVFLKGGARARHLTSEIIASIKGQVVAEGSDRVVTAPFEEMFVNGKQV